MSFCGLNVDMETSAPLVNDIINNAMFHSCPHTNQTPHQIIHNPALLSGFREKASTTPNAPRIIKLGVVASSSSWTICAQPRSVVDNVKSVLD